MNWWPRDLVAYRGAVGPGPLLPDRHVRVAAAVWPLVRSFEAWRTPPLQPIHGGNMKVSLWAEIRRLHEIERFRRRAIARRLHCCTKTVAKAWQCLTAHGEAEPRRSILDPYRAQIDALLAKYPDLNAVRVMEEISKGEDGYRGTVYPVRDTSAGTDRTGRVYQEVFDSRGKPCRWIGATAGG